MSNGPVYVRDEETGRWAAFVRFNAPTYAGRAFGPKDADHPTIGVACPACNLLFQEGDMTALIALGPGDDPEAQERARTSRWYNARAIEVHLACAGGKETD